jgi:hypothetical protein
MKIVKVIGAQKKISHLDTLVEDGIVYEDVIRILEDCGLGLPDYYKWRTRSGCYFCFYQTEDEWRGLKKYHPAEFEKACQYEENHSDGRTYTWRGKRGGKPLFLRDIEDNISVEKQKTIQTPNNKLCYLLNDINVIGLDNSDFLK